MDLGYYLQGKCRPDCSFVLKNANIDINKECECLQDFIIFVGELKSLQVPISNKSSKGQICQYLNTLLKVQNRQRVYGFLMNFTYITFFYVEKKPYSDGYQYFISEDLKMYHYSSKTSSNFAATTTTTLSTQYSNKLYLDKHTWIIFTKFLIMNMDFYQYITLNINPTDDLLGDKYHLTRKLGDGVTSRVYLLEKIMMLMIYEYVL
jgi:hypothetical protein